MKSEDTEALVASG